MADELRQATLDGLQGLGEFKVVRSVDSMIIAIAGIWRAADGRDVETSGLYLAQQADRDVTYLGPIDDPGAPDAREAEIEARITSVDDYSYDDGVTRTLFKLNCIDKLTYRTTASAEGAAAPQSEAKA